MGAPKLENRISQRYADLAHEADLQWLDSAEIYASEGVLNFEINDFLVHQVHWFELFAQKRIYNVTKDIFDRMVAVSALLILSPLFLLIAIGIKLTTPGAVFFRQKRIGKGCQPFTIYKFRTMYNGVSRTFLMGENEMRGGLFKIRKDSRITPLGSFLRRWSLDELPQLLNIAFGHMSLVGPRPLPPEDTATVTVNHYIRFAVKPGLTGLWQSTYRDTNDGQLKLRKDAEYVRVRSWKTDLSILWKTIPTVLKGIGAW